LTTKLLSTFKQDIKDLVLTPAGGGCFEVQYDDELVYSKLKTGQFPDEESLVKLAEKKLK
jgi:selenoprotein W-related protein